MSLNASHENTPGVDYYKLSELQEMVEGKCVAVIGNAISLIDANLGPNIDKFDVISRINQGFPQKHPTHLGIKTDVWTNNQVMPLTPIREMGVKFHMYAAPYNEDPAANYFYQQKHNSEYDEYCRGWSIDRDLLHRIHRKLGYKSSSGLRTIMVYYELCKPASITLFGFDFLKTYSWYWAHYRDFHSPNHCGSAEEKFLRDLSSEPEIWLVHPKAKEGRIELMNVGTGSSLEEPRQVPMPVPPHVWLDHPA